jgi:ribosomal protein S18 acetylase RimI-like enzyme
MRSNKNECLNCEYSLVGTLYHAPHLQKEIWLKSACYNAPIKKWDMNRMADKVITSLDQVTSEWLTAVFPTGGPYEQIVPATPEDLPLVMGIIAEAAAWLKEKRIDQWPSPPNQHWWRRTAAFIETGEMHIAYQDGTAIGVLRLNWADTYWPDDGLAGYVRGLAICNRAHGRGVGQALLVWAGEEIRQHKRPFLRLDCAASNGRLRQYYEDQGFTFRGQVTDYDYVAALYEFVISTSSTQALNKVEGKT